MAVVEVLKDIKKQMKKTKDKVGPNLRPPFWREAVGFFFLFFSLIFGEGLLVFHNAEVRLRPHLLLLIHHLKDRLVQVVSRALG